MKCAAHHMEPNMDRDDENPSTCQDDNEDEEVVEQTCPHLRLIQSSRATWPVTHPRNESAGLQR